MLRLIAKAGLLKGGTIGVDATDAGEQQLVWRNRAGEKPGAIGRPQERFQYPALSLDGISVAVSGMENNNGAVWLHDGEQPIKTRLTFSLEGEFFPTWSPSGNEISYESHRSGGGDLYRRAADGGGEVGF